MKKETKKNLIIQSAILLVILLLVVSKTITPVNERIDYLLNLYNACTLPSIVAATVQTGGPMPSYYCGLLFGNVVIILFVLILILIMVPFILRFSTRLKSKQGKREKEL